jgi:UDP-2,4-diacetamido-2,4,6-trideoxy-beta-L-altropyranose hydrolase
MRLLFRCDGAKEIGMGHVARDITLANELTRRYDVEVGFVCIDSLPVRKLLDRAGYPCHTLPARISIQEEKLRTQEIVGSLGASCVVVDLLHLDIDSQFMASLRATAGYLVAITDDSFPRHIAADLVVNGNPNQRHDSYANSEGVLYLLGPDFFIMDPSYPGLRARPLNFSTEPTSVFVSMGGSDNNDLVLLVVDALERIDSLLEVTVVTGVAFGPEAELRRRVETARHRYVLRSNVTDFPDLLAAADLAITAGGNTLFNRLCVGTPGVVVCQLDRQNEIATAFASKGATANLGMWDRVSSGDIADAAQGLLRSKRAREAMSTAGRNMVDGRGCERVAGEIGRGLGLQSKAQESEAIC